ncbi:DUF2235 domain-containing protein [Paracoccus sp. MBLB3053]|uniref:DUF2235 domain-containing protein n=1 Tax=Paracoccus aurantius TaxID=3073814 RepID=A0ABU2HYI6_9RHOB|nr:DUF2235 domain-containing protein [Paracoccus sp. MBLB3053]MDS9469802.1 DUF2235 domain-containing protein [Paracoccus sp. MBLB3053]
MPKNLVIGCDGTWNDPEDETNIHWLTSEAVKDARQLVYYDKGVGTAGDLDAKIGGNFGIGLSENVRQAYAFLLKNYEPGDAVFLFGFSRGAFTVRSMAGFMRLVGRLRSPELIEQAYIYYRVHEPGEDDSFFERILRPEVGAPMPIRFLGVFDTVGSLGLPFEISGRAPDLRRTPWARAGSLVTRWLDELGDRVRRPIKGFHDTRLGDQVEEAAQALAMDERRGFFTPTLWTEAPGEALKCDPTGRFLQVPQAVSQVWFAGSHIDVGGGDTAIARSGRLSNIPLLWLAERAEAAGMRFRAGFLEQLREWRDSLATAAQNDPWSERWERLHRQTGVRWADRPIGNASRRAADPTGMHWPLVATPETIHSSLTKRRGQMVTILGEGGVRRSELYEPENLVPEMIETA